MLHLWRHWFNMANIFQILSTVHVHVANLSVDKNVSNNARKLFLISVPPNITLQSKYYVGREKSVSLDCKVDGYPPPTITWTPCNAQENVCDQSVLNILKVQNDGIYTCTAKNCVGNDSASTSLGKSFYFMCASFLCSIFSSSKIDTILPFHWWEYYSITLSKYCESTRLTFFFYSCDEMLSLMKGQKDKKPGVKLLMVINVSLAFFVGRDPLGALLDFHLT